MNAKLAFRNSLQAKNQGKLPLVPLTYGLAARIANVPLKEMVYDPTLYANSIEAAYKLFRYDIIVNCFDSTVEAERFGCETEWSGEFDTPGPRKGCTFVATGPEDFMEGGRIPVLIEGSKRLVLSFGREAGIVCVVTGALSLLANFECQAPSSDEGELKAMLSGISGCYIKLIRSLCEMKVDAVLFREDMLGNSFWESLLLHKEAYKTLYTTLFNIIRAYNAFPLLIVRDFPSKEIPSLYSLMRPNGLALLGTKLDENELAQLHGLSKSLRMSFGLPLPIGTGTLDELWKSVALVESFVDGDKTHGFFYISDGEIPQDMPLDIMHEVMTGLRLKVNEGM
jgi:hypothetical protein